MRERATEEEERLAAEESRARAAGLPKWARVGKGSMVTKRRLEIQGLETEAGALPAPCARRGVLILGHLWAKVEEAVRWPRRGWWWDGVGAAEEDGAGGVGSGERVGIFRHAMLHLACGVPAVWPWPEAHLVPAGGEGG